ncbi:MAG: hypothetical protein RDA78_21780 [Roseibium sp.]|uniref:calcium-binding protein n=1 Tax=Roseibium sp. TaxID=1936156 RepID=UPI003D9C5B8E
MPFSISFDFRFDDGGFFNDPNRRAILELAAEEWERVINDEFDDIPEGAALSVVDPDDPSQLLTVELTEPIDDLLIFVGSNDMGGYNMLPDGSLSATIGQAYSVFGGDGDAMRLRTVADFRSQGPTSDFEPFVGSIALNNNNEINWSFSADGPVDGFADAYSTIVHEIGHILGIGASPTFDALIVGTGFTGPNARGANGGVPVPLEPDGNHVREGFAGDSVVMDPILALGTRTVPTAIDLALLVDIGYEIDGYVKQGTAFALTTPGDDNPVFGSEAADSIDGLGGNDWLQGEGGNDALDGGDGADTLFGGFGADALVGGDGDDQVLGNQGEDVIDGGSGDDNLFGGSDYDTFVFVDDWGADSVIDPDANGRLLFVGYDEADLSFSQSGGNLFVDAGTNRVVFFDYYSNGSSYDFVFEPFADMVSEGTDTSVNLSVGSWTNGTINAEPIVGDGVTFDLVGGFVDKDWYRVTLEADRSYSFDAQSLSMTTGNVFIRLYDSAGNEVGGSSEAEGAAPSFTYATAGQPGSQTYYLAVSAGDNGEASEPFRTATGDFQVRFTDGGAVTTSDVAGNTSTTADLLVGGTVVGEIQQNDVGGSYIDTDYFRVTLTGGQRYTFSADAAVDSGDALDEVFIRLRDVQGRVLSPDIRDEGATPQFVFDAPGSGPQTFYLAISAGGNGAWWDDVGAYSVSLAAEGAVPQPVNYRPVAEATDFVGDPADDVPLTDLFSYSDPDGISDIVNFAVQDRTRECGHLTYLGQRMDPNVVYERPIGEIGDWAFVVGPHGTDYVGFNAIDSEGAFNTSAVAAVSAAQFQGPQLASAEDLFGQQKLSTLAQFSNAAYYLGGTEAVDALSDKGWRIIDSVYAGSLGINNISDKHYISNALNLFPGSGERGSALLAEAPDGKSLVLSFTGTDQHWPSEGFEIGFDWLSFTTNHFDLFLPLFNDIDFAKYEKVYATGHSMGAAMAQAFVALSQRGSPVTYGEQVISLPTPFKVEGVGFANPGFGFGFDVFDFQLPHLEEFTNITINGDPIQFAQVLSNNAGDIINLEISRELAVNQESLHAMDLYEDAARFFDERSVDVFALQSNGRPDSKTYYYTPLGEIYVGGEGSAFSVVGSPNGALVNPDGVIHLGQPTVPTVADQWTFSTDSDDPSTLTIDASAFTNTDWTISADGGEVVLTDAALQELLRFDDFGSFQVNSSWADLDLKLLPYDGTDILPNTVYVSAGIGDDNIDGSATDRRIVATGGGGNDTLIGGAPGDHLSGDDGDDTIDGGGGDDFLEAGQGNDVAFGGDGNDTIRGRGGDDDIGGGDGADVLFGGAGADALNGGAGGDRAQYSDATAWVTADLANSANNTGEAAGDTYVSIEHLYGTHYSDSLRGDSIGNWIWGGTGNDTLRGWGGNDRLDGGDGADVLFGGAGADILIGGAGGDRAQYSDATSWVTADLANSANNTGEAAGDTYSGIEHLYGTHYSDSLRGDSVGNWIWGGTGNDTLRGWGGNDRLDGGDGADVLFGGAGADILIGGAGGDRAQYSDATSWVTADLANSANNTGEAAGDTYSGIEHLYGTHYSDSLRGDSLGNWIWGGTGNDTLRGWGGNDRLDGGDGADVLFGGAGADILIGGAGGDRVQYSDATSSVTADLANSANNTGEAAGDTYSGIEHLYGTHYSDSLRGNSIGNWIWGGSGDDHIAGREGNDYLFGGTGADTFEFFFGDGDDVIADFSVGEDLLDFATTLGVSSVSEADIHGGTDLDTILALNSGDTLILTDVNGISVSELFA